MQLPCKNNVFNTKNPCTKKPEASLASFCAKHQQIALNDTATQDKTENARSNKNKKAPIDT
jgi:hypothetical protein